MGCCISTNKEAQPSSISKKDLGSDEVSKLKGFSHESRGPPPSVEEETVKEVLSETPKPKPQEAEEEEGEEEEEEIKNTHKLEVFAKIQENLRYEKNVDRKQQLNGNEEITLEESEITLEVSEICSLSVSESVSTMTNITDKRDNEEEQEVKQQRVSRSPGKLQPRNGMKRDRVVNQSPTRRSDQSPARRINNGSARFVQSGREEAGQTMGRRGSITNPGRRDPGEGSGRRSRSPATTRSSPTSAMGRSPSVRRANRSPGRVKTDPIENSNCSNNNSTKVNGRNTEGKRQSNNDINCSTNESLENPLVSLECFIFL